MKTFYLVLFLGAVLASVFTQTSLRPGTTHRNYLQPQSSSAGEIGIAQYPQGVYLPEATERLLEAKASSWVLARAYHTDDSIKDVTKYFKAQAQKAKKPADTNAILKSLLRDNWKIRKGTVRGASIVFGVGAELRTPGLALEAETTFGVIVLDDSIVRVHLMSPHPASDNNKLVSGTMISLIRERLAQPAEPAANETGSAGEKVYYGREVTRRARVKKKPEPEYTASGIGGTVVLRAVLSASGKVTNISVVSGLRGGLTEESIEAARKISFEPAIKDGHYVSTYVQLEYHFHP